MGWDAACRKPLSVLDLAPETSQHGAPNGRPGLLIETAMRRDALDCGGKAEGDL